MYIFHVTKKKRCRTMVRTDWPQLHVAICSYKSCHTQDAILSEDVAMNDFVYAHILIY